MLRERALELTWRIRDRKRAKERYNSTKSRTTKVVQYPSRGRAEVELAESTGRVYIGIAPRKVRGRENTTEDSDSRNCTSGYGLLNTQRLGLRATDVIRDWGMDARIV